AARVAFERCARGDACRGSSGLRDAVGRAAGGRAARGVKPHRPATRRCRLEPRSPVSGESRYNADMSERNIGKLVLVRHGQSDWNLKNLFTGWTDVDLTEQGRREARDAGRTLREEGLYFDIAFTSVLVRAIRTLWLALDEMRLMWIPVERHWRLNERHYGALQGLDKAETAAKHGAEQVKIWRRSYDIPPPPLEP